MAITPSAATRVAFLSALASPCLRISSAAASRSPPTSTSAFLHSIMPAPVRSRSCLTASAVIVIVVPSNQVVAAACRDIITFIGAGSSGPGGPARAAGVARLATRRGPPPCRETLAGRSAVAFNLGGILLQVLRFGFDRWRRRGGVRGQGLGRGLAPDGGLALGRSGLAPRRLLLWIALF